MSGIGQKDRLAKANPNYNGDDDDGFLDIDELLAGLQQESTSTSAKLDTDGMAGKVGDRTRGNSPADSSRSTVGSTQGKHTPFLNLAGSSYLNDPRSDYTK